MRWASTAVAASSCQRYLLLNPHNSSTAAIAPRSSGTDALPRTFVLTGISAAGTSLGRSLASSTEADGTGIRCGDENKEPWPHPKVGWKLRLDLISPWIEAGAPHANREAIVARGCRLQTRSDFAAQTPRIFVWVVAFMDRDTAMSATTLARSATAKGFYFPTVTRSCEPSVMRPYLDAAPGPNRVYDDGKRKAVGPGEPVM